MSTAEGLAELVSKWLVDHGLDLCKIRGQGYDGASVMSGKVKVSEFQLLFIVFHKSFRPLTPIYLMVNCNTCVILGIMFCLSERHELLLGN